MAYEMLIKSSKLSEKPANKPIYTPAKSFKNLLKVLRRVFHKSGSKQFHQFQDEHIWIENCLVDSENEVAKQQEKKKVNIELEVEAAESDRSTEECDNIANELREANASAWSLH